MSQNLEKTYDPKAIESKLYDRWCEKKYFSRRSGSEQKTVYLP